MLGPLRALAVGCRAIRWVQSIELNCRLSQRVELARLCHFVLLDLYGVGWVKSIFVRRDADTSFLLWVPRLLLVIYQASLFFISLFWYTFFFARHQAVYFSDCIFLLTDPVDPMPALRLLTPARVPRAAIMWSVHRLLRYHIQIEAIRQHFLTISKLVGEWIWRKRTQ